MKYRINEKESVELFQLVGGFGLYTVGAATIMSFMSMFATESIAVNFIGYTQTHWCRVPRLQNFSFEEQKYIAIPKSSDGDYSSCQVFKLNYSSYSEQDFLNWDRNVMVSNETETQECDDWVFDRSLFVSTFTSKFNLVCGRSWMVQLVSTLFMGGLLVGAISSGIISDKIGRKATILVFTLLKILMSILCALAPNYPVLIIGRFLLGLSSVGCFLVAYVLAMEMLSDSGRTTVGVVYQMIFACGYFLWSGVSYAIRDQVKVQIAMLVPQVFFLLVFWPIQESPLWLLSRSKNEEAEKVLRKISTINGAQLPEDFSIANIEQELEEPSKKTCVDLFRSSTMRWRTLIIYLHWFTDSLMYYALSLNTGALAGSVFVNTVISGAVEIPANLLCTVGLKWKYTGRRLTCSVSLIIAGVASLIAIPIILNDFTTAATALSMVGKAFVTVGFSGIYLYSVELFPTEVRNVGLGSSSMCARISGMPSAYIGGPLGNVWKPLPSLVFGVLGTVSGVLTLFLPETLGHDLPETIEDAENLGKKKSKVAPMELQEKGAFEDKS